MGLSSENQQRIKSQEATKAAGGSVECIGTLVVAK